MLEGVEKMSIREMFYLMVTADKTTAHHLLVEKNTLNLYKKLRKAYLSYCKNSSEPSTDPLEVYNYGLNNNHPYLEVSYPDYLSDIDFTYLKQLAAADNIFLEVKEDSLSSFHTSIYLESSVITKEYSIMR